MGAPRYGNVQVENTMIYVDGGKGHWLAAGWRTPHQCNVDAKIDHLDQAESYPVDENNPIGDAAKEYKIYSTCI